MYLDVLYILYLIFSSRIFWQDAKTAGKIRHFKNPDTDFPCPKRWEGIWAFGRQLRPLESTRCMACMAWAAWRVATRFSNHLDHRWSETRRIWTNRQLKHLEIYTSKLKSIANLKFLGPSLCSTWSKPRSSVGSLAVMVFKFRPLAISNVKSVTSEQSPHLCSLDISGS